MKFVMPRKAFLAALKTVQPAVSRRATLPILSGIKLDAAKDRLTMEATDLETVIATTIATDVEKPGVVVAPASALIKAVGALSDPMIEVTTEDLRLTVRCGKRTVTVQGFSSEDWPSSRIVDIGTSALATVDARALADALARVVVCASTDEARPVLTGVALFMDGKAQAMDLVATDSYRLGAVRVQVRDCGEVPSEPMIIPARTARALAKHLRKARGEVRIHVDDGPAGRLVAVRFGDDTWSMRAIEGQFPDWRQILGGQGGARLELDADETSSALKTMAAVRSNGTPVRLSLGERCTIAMSEKDVGEVTESLGSATYAADGVGAIEIGFNADYLADAIRFIGEGRTEVHIRDALKPAIFEYADRRYALMPVRLS
jgi:DNA polymerase-3 subunit beta